MRLKKSVFIVNAQNTYLLLFTPPRQVDTKDFQNGNFPSLWNNCFKAHFLTVFWVLFVIPQRQIGYTNSPGASRPLRNVGE